MAGFCMRPHACSLYLLDGSSGKPFDFHFARPANQKDCSLMPGIQFRELASEYYDLLQSALVDIPKTQVIPDFMMKYLPRGRGTGVDCMVCGDTVTKGVDFIRLACNCETHETCLTRWLSQKASCPACAHPVDVHTLPPGLFGMDSATNLEDAAPTEETPEGGGACVSLFQQQKSSAASSTDTTTATDENVARATGLQARPFRIPNSQGGIHVLPPMPPRLQEEPSSPPAKRRLEESPAASQLSPPIEKSATMKAKQPMKVSRTIARKNYVATKAATVDEKRRDRRRLLNVLGARIARNEVGQKEVRSKMHQISGLDAQLTFL